MDIKTSSALYNNMMGLNNTESLAKVSGNSKDIEKLKESASKFETEFIHMMLKEMRKTVPKSEYLSSGNSEDTYYEMHDYEIAKEIAKKNSIGIASLLLKRLNNEMKIVQPSEVKVNTES